MSGGMESHESEIAVTLDLANLPSVSTKLEILHSDFVVGLLPRPFQCFSPGLIPKPVANEVCVTLGNRVSIHVEERPASRSQLDR